MKPLRHFLRLDDLSADELRGLIARASELKALQHRRAPHASLPGRTLAMLFEKASTRTRVSFEAGMAQLGGSALFLSPKDLQLGRGEPIADTARVIGSMVDAIMIRTFDHATLETFAEHAGVPVINGLSNAFHPCQLLADLQTWFEHRGDIRGARVCWLGDGNNMCQSYINAARLLDFELVIACPTGYTPCDALYFHCLPAHRGEEITAELMASPATVIWEEAENRLHAQKALLEFLMR
jgi:ornithine carbamoyltransferase